MGDWNWDEASSASSEEAAASGPAMENSVGELSEHEMNSMIEEICNSKAEEFHMLGYDSVTGRDIWDCVSAKYKETPPLHRVVNNILSLRTTDFMNWMTMSAWKQSDK